MKLENRLYKVMCDKGVTRYRLAKLTGFQWDHINNIAKQKGKASVGAAHVIAAALRCSVADIFEEESTHS